MNEVYFGRVEGFVSIKEQLGQYYNLRTYEAR